MIYKWLHNVATLFPSSFDWGSFWGGVVGALGAFGSAILIYYLQNRTRRRREMIQIRLKASRVIRDSLNILNSLPQSMLHMLLVSEKVIIPIEDILPTASENDNALFATMTKLVERLGQIINEYGSTTPQCILDLTNALTNTLDKVALLNREYL